MALIKCKECEHEASDKASMLPNSKLIHKEILIKRIFILFVVIVLISGDILAYDFEVNGLYYNLTSNNTVGVTYKNKNESSYCGDIIIPSKVEHDGVVYDVTSIGSSAFSECGDLSSIIIGANIQDIEDHAFYCCSSLKSVSIPSNVLSMEATSFFNCTSLRKVFFEDGKDILNIKFVYSIYYSYDIQMREIQNTFYNCPIEYVFLGRNIEYEVSNDGGGGLFQNFPTLKSIDFGESVSTLPQFIFAQTQIKELKLSKNISYIGVGSFAYCDSLSNIFFNDSIKKIDYSAFDHCLNLKEIVIPSCLERLNCSFYGCSFSKFVIEKAATDLEMGANTYVIPNSGKWVNHWFSDHLLASCNIDTLILGRYVKSTISSRTPFENNFRKVIITKDYERWNPLLFQHSSIDSLYIEDGHSEILGRPSIKRVQNLYLGRNVQDHCFSSKLTLRSVIIGDYVTEIPSNCFNNCRNIQTLIIGQNVNTIGLFAFYDVGAYLNYAECRSLTPPIFEGPYGNKAIFRVSPYGKATLNVPTESISLYKESTWADYFIIEENESTNVKEVVWEFQDKNDVIYNIKGNRIMVNENRTYPKGIYVINGKKYLMK